MRGARYLALVVGAGALSVMGRIGGAQVSAGAGALAAVMEHRVNAGFGVERSLGLTVGAEATVRLRPWLDAGLHLRGGTLAADTGGAADRDLADLGARVRVRALSWFAFTAEATRRTYSSVIALERWTLLALGTEVRLPFSDRAVVGVLRAAALPVVDVNGRGDADAGFSVGAGMEYRHNRVEVGLWYSLERYEWPTSQGRRLEQLSGLTLGFRARVLGR